MPPRANTPTPTPAPGDEQEQNLRRLAQQLGWDVEETRRRRDALRGPLMVGEDAFRPLPTVSGTQATQEQAVGLFGRAPQVAAAPPPRPGGVPPPRPQGPPASASGFTQGLLSQPGAALAQGRYPKLLAAGGQAPPMPSVLGDAQSWQDLGLNMEQNGLREDLRQMFPSASDLQGRARLDAMQAGFAGVPAAQTAQMLQEGLAQADRAYQGGLQTQAGLLGQQTSRDMDLAKLGFEQSRQGFAEREADRRFDLDASRADRERYKDSPQYQSYLAELERYRQTGFLPDDRESEQLLERAQRYRPSVRTEMGGIGVGRPGEAPPPPEKEGGLKKSGGGAGASTIAARIDRALPRGPGVRGTDKPGEITSILSAFTDEELADRKTFNELNKQLTANYGSAWRDLQKLNQSPVGNFNSDAVRQVMRMDAAYKRLTGGQGRNFNTNVGQDIGMGATAGAIGGSFIGPWGTAAGGGLGGLGGAAKNLLGRIFD